VTEKLNLPSLTLGAGSTSQLVRQVESKRIIAKIQKNFFTTNSPFYLQS
jgi:hypothetical protein